MNKLAAWLNILESWTERLRQRRRLAGLDARALADLGLDPGQINREIEKPFWRS